MNIFDDWPELEQEYKFTCSSCGHDKYKPIDEVHHSSKIFIYKRKACGLTEISRSRDKTITEMRVRDVAECSNCSYHVILNESIVEVKKKTQQEYRDNLNQVRFEKEKQTGFLAPEQL